MCRERDREHREKGIEPRKGGTEHQERDREHRERDREHREQGTKLWERGRELTRALEAPASAGADGESPLETPAHRTRGLGPAQPWECPRTCFCTGMNSVDWAR